MADREPTDLAGLFASPCGVWVRRSTLAGLCWWRPLAGATRRSMGLWGIGAKP